MGENDSISRRHAPLYRSSDDRVLGGVCAGIAEYLGLDTMLVRIATVLLALVTGGAVALAYLLAWVVVPPSSGERTSRPKSASRREPLDGQAERSGPREAWNAAGEELRGLVASIRNSGGGPDTSSDARRSPVASVDAAMTSFGERLRDEQVQADARRTATRVSAAVNATVQDVSRRTRRQSADGDPTPTDAGQAGQAGQDNAPGS